MGEKRRIVRLVAATGQATAVYEDGTTQHMVFSGEDVELLQATPRGGCQRCGHDQSEHGDWEFDGTDEYWQESACTFSLQCPCAGWVPFTPWLGELDDG